MPSSLQREQSRPCLAAACRHTQSVKRRATLWRHFCRYPLTGVPRTPANARCWRWSQGSRWPAPKHPAGALGHSLLWVLEGRVPCHALRHTLRDVLGPSAVLVGAPAPLPSLGAGPRADKGSKARPRQAGHAGARLAPRALGPGVLPLETTSSEQLWVRVAGPGLPTAATRLARGLAARALPIVALWVAGHDPRVRAGSEGEGPAGAGVL